MAKSREVTELVKELREISSKIVSKTDWTYQERLALGDRVRKLAARVDKLDARKITQEELDPSEKKRK